MNGFIVLVFLLVLRSQVDCVAKNGKKTCSQLTSAHRNIPQTLLLKDPVEGHNLKICQSNLTCCSKQMESELYMRSSRVLENAVYDQTNATHHFLTTQASLFDDHIKNLLKTGKLKWHNLLYKTYNDIYLRHRHIFDEFFSTLIKYHVSGDVDLDQSLHVFFQRIQNTMFTLLNKNLASKPGFLNCTSKHIDDIQPFGKYQSQIIDQLKPTLVYARAFVVALQTGSNITASINHYLSRNECKEGFTKIQHCSLCEGIPDAKVCNATCHNLLQSCFLLGSLFHTYWDDFAGDIYVLSTRLDGQYNIEAILGQLGFDISNAIMEFQRKFALVFAKAQRLCPTGSRKKRALDKSGRDLYLEGEGVRRSPGLLTLSSAKQVPPSFDRFITAFQKELNGIKDVWKYLPQKICGRQTFVARGSNESCWNGIEMQKNSGKAPTINMDADESVSRQLIIQQLLNLREIVRNVLKDQNDYMVIVSSGGGNDHESGSGSGSGEESGSGDNMTEPTTGINVNVARPSTSTGQIPLITTDDTVLSDGNTDDTGGSGTSAYNQISTTSASTTDDEDLDTQSGSGNETTTDPTMVDDDDNSKTPAYNQFSTTSASTTDDEDLDTQSGSGNDTTTDPTMVDDDDNSNSVPTTIVKTTHRIFGNTVETLGSGSCSNLISYVFVLLVTLVGFVNM